MVTTSALTVVKNKIPDVISLVKKKTDYNTKISEIEKKLTDHNHDKYITTPEFNKFTADIFATRLAQANLIIKILRYCQASIKRLTQTKQKIYLLKIN